MNAVVTAVIADSKEAGSDAKLSFIFASRKFVEGRCCWRTRRMASTGCRLVGGR